MSTVPAVRSRGLVLRVIYCSSFQQLDQRGKEDILVKGFTEMVTNSNNENLRCLFYLLPFERKKINEKFCRQSASRDSNACFSRKMSTFVIIADWCRLISIGSADACSGTDCRF